MSQERTDKNGRVFAGSQRHIQTYVNEYPDQLNQAIFEQLTDLAGHQPKVEWVSPLAKDKYREYKDAEFLGALGLEHLNEKRKDFWPAHGPVWDGLALLRLSATDGQAKIELQQGTKGVILLEAKSHPEEIISSCQAKDPGSIRKIKEALDQAKRGREVPENADWMKDYYQYANRLAHLDFLYYQGVASALVGVYFLNDPHFSSSPKTKEEWQGPINKMKERLGLLGKGSAHVAEVFLEAK